MGSSKKHLIIVCSNFPYGFGEPFLEVELGYLRKQFNRITICTTGNSNSEKQFDVPQDVELIALNPDPSFTQKLTGIWRLFFDAEITNEIKTITTDYHGAVNWGKLKTMLVSRLRAKQIKAEMETKIKWNPDAEVFLYSYWTDDAALALVYLKNDMPNATAFCRLHGWDLYFERSSYHYLPFRKRIFNGLNAVFAISENGRNYLLSHFSSIINEGRIYQSRLGIRTVNQLQEHKRDFRTFKLISCSNIIPIKRVHLIVQALSEIEGLEIDWTHFGDGTEKEELTNLCEELLDQKENIQYHFPGRLPNWKVLEYYSSHMVDLFISLSRYDGIPVSIMEAMSFGIPAIATNVGGVSEIVINGKTGFLLDQEVVPKDVAEVIVHTAQMQTEEYNQMRIEAKNIWGTYYSADINYPDFCERVLSFSNG
ncbi:MAG: colanic acid/amylovoran biosynthesis glycosyltransferase [Psychroserpens sp.]|jgi:colanic acid/amylovoran biosynthesis glycosyltransferase